MKKFLLFTVALLLSAGVAFAQRGLSSNRVFRGNVVPLSDMVVTEVRGESLASYKLDYYRGVSFQADAARAAEVAALVEADAAAAASCETEREGSLLTYALIQPKPFGRTNRYLCYQARRDGDGWKVTLLYLEGAARLEDLRSAFEKQ